MNKNCLTCKKEFSKPYNESKKVWNSGRHIYCSRSCHFPPKVTIVCWECKGYFTVKNYRKETAHFCSQECSHQYRNTGQTPINKVIRKSVKYKAWRTLVFERDNYICQFCGIYGVYLHADHIKPFALYPELRFEIFNGRTLCVPCHKQTPTYGRTKLFRNVAVA